MVNEVIIILTAKANFHILPAGGFDFYSLISQHEPASKGLSHTLSGSYAYRWLYVGGNHTPVNIAKLVFVLHALFVALNVTANKPHVVFKNESRSQVSGQNKIHTSSCKLK